MVLNMERWAGKVAVVTGASSGIGAAIAEQLVANGLIVAGIARRSVLVCQLSKKLEDKRKKGKLYPVKADITKEADVLAAFKWIKENLGPISIVVNNAGYLPQGSLLDDNDALWSKAFDVNVLGLCMVTREAVKSMRENDINGHVIDINSVMGHTVSNLPGFNVYPATKFAITALVPTLGTELLALNSKIKVTSLSPGLVHTGMTSQKPGLSPEEKKRYAKLKAMNPEDVADCVIYALSTPEHVQIYELTVKAVGGP